MNYKLQLTAVLLCFYAVVGSEEITENDGSESSDDAALHRVRRGGLSMLRLGRGLQMLRLGKRALPMLRLGRSAPSDLTNDEIQYILSLMRTDRTVPLPRYGKDLSFEYMLMNALKNAEQNSDMYDDDEEPSYGYGYDLSTAPARHIRPAPRPGMRYRRSADSEAENQEDKRAPPVMRYGKEAEDESVAEDSADDEEVVKRAMRMLRLGRGMRMLRLGKRPVDSEEDYTETDKRALRLLRLGKRPFHMLRLGRSDNDDEKRALRLLRLGRNSPSSDES